MYHCNISGSPGELVGQNVRGRPKVSKRINLYGYPAAETSNNVWGRRQRYDVVVVTIISEGPVTGTGILRAQSSTMAGSGLSASSGTGVFLAEVATVSGVGLSASSGPGILLAGVSTTNGAGLSASSGEGLLVCLSSSMVSVGISESSGSGVLLANFSNISGMGISASSGTGVLVVAGDSGMNGVGIVSGGGSGSNGQDSRKVLLDWDGIKHRGS